MMNEEGKMKDGTFTNNEEAGVRIIQSPEELGPGIVFFQSIRGATRKQSV